MLPQLKLLKRLRAASRSIPLAALVSIWACGGSGEDASDPESGRPAGGEAVEVKEAPPGAYVVEDITPGRRGGTLVLGMAGDPKTFNLALVDDVPSQRIAGYFYDSMYGYDNFKQEDEERICESWEYDEGRREWTFKLREGLRWSDGEPLTSDDLIFWTEVINDERVPSSEREFMKSDGKPFTYYAPDPLTFVAQIPAIDSFAFMSLGLIRPLPRHKYEKYLRDGNYAEKLGTDVDPEDLVTSGPYKLKEFVSGQKVVLERNPFYYVYDKNGTQLPYFDEVVFLNVENFDAMALRFQAGDLDILEELQPANLSVIEDGQAKGDYTLFNPGLSLSNNHYWFNLKRGGSYEDEEGDRIAWAPSALDEAPPADILAKSFRYYVDPIKRKWFEKVEFRQACSMATNRAAIVRTILYGEGAPLYGVVGDSNKMWHNPNIPKFAYDPDKAKALLDSIGFTDRDGDGVREDAEGNAIRFTIISNKENNVREKIGVLLKEDMNKIGFDVSIQMIDFNDLITRISDSYDYQACNLGIGSGVPPHPSMSRNFWLTSGRLHQWSPEQTSPATDWERELDEMYGSLTKEFEYEKQKAIYDKMQMILHERQPMIHTVQLRLYVAARNNLGNLKPTVLRPYLTHNLEELYLISR